jgi:hypothetical protein
MGKNNLKLTKTNWFWGWFIAIGFTFFLIWMLYSIFGW